MNPAEILIQIVVLLLALCFHEMAHAWMANRCGDPTAANLGRLTMDPRAHIDPFGTIIFPGLLLLTGAPFLFGWAKPVPYNPRNLRNPGRDDALIAAAGPGSNVLMALGATLWFHLVVYLTYKGILPGSLAEPLTLLLSSLVIINLVLAFFNLIPLPPLDGGGILTNLLPASYSDVTVFLRQYGPMLFIIALVMGLTSYFVYPGVRLGIFLLSGS